MKGDSLVFRISLFWLVFLAACGASVLAYALFSSWSHTERNCTSKAVSTRYPAPMVQDRLFTVLAVSTAALSVALMVAALFWHWAAENPTNASNECGQ
jgi:hypothetical protein